MGIVLETVVIEVIVAVLLLTGATFVFLSGLGMVIMPDVYLRMSAATKASTVGVGGMLVAAAVVFAQDGIIMAQVVATILFLFFTAPVSAHLIGRAAYLNGVAPDKTTFHDDLKDYCDANGLPRPGHIAAGAPEEVIDHAGQAS